MFAALRIASGLPLACLCEPPYEEGGAGIVQRCAARLEADIRSARKDWPWFHRRWKD